MQTPKFLAKLNPLPKLKAFWYVFHKSASSPNYYKEVLETKISFSIKYFLALAAFLAVALSARFAIVQLPKVVSDLKGTVELAKGAFEDDLVIEITDDNWTINKHEPYSINLEWENAQIPGLKEKQHLIVLDHAGTIDKFDEYDTFVLVNGKNIITKDSTGLQIMPISETGIPKGKITKTEFLGAIEQAEEYLKLLPIVGTLMAFFSLMFYFVVIIGANLLLIALPVWLFSQIIELKPSKIIKNTNAAPATNIGYLNSLKTAIHAATLPLTLYTLTKVAGLEAYSGTLAFWTQVAILLIALLVIGWLSKSKPTTGVSAQAPQPPTETTAETKSEFKEPDNI